MEKEIKKVILSNPPHIHTRTVLFNEQEEIIEDKNKKQFITCKETTLTVKYTDNSEITITAPKGYKFDGATIPFGIGKGDMKLLIPALFHDIMCDNKAVINYNRKQADLIFKECLVECGVNRILAQLMYLAVEAYQILFCDWSKKK